MIELIRIFDNSERRMKSSYDSGYRNYLNNWANESHSSCALKIENRLFLLKELKPEIILNKSIGLIVISEDNREDKSYISMYPKNHKFLKLGSLKIRRIKDSLFEIHVISSKNVSFLEIPSPERSAHKVAEIKPNKTIRYRSNYKYDTWGFMRGQRSFLEEDYIIQHLGFVDEIDFSMNQKSEVKINIDKVVNERKILK